MNGIDVVVSLIIAVIGGLASSVAVITLANRLPYLRYSDLESSEQLQTSLRRNLIAAASIVVWSLVILAITPDYGFLRTVFSLFYGCWLLLIIVIDIDHRLILFETLGIMVLVALVDAAIPDSYPNLPVSLLGGVLGFVVFYVLYWGGKVFLRMRLSQPVTVSDETTEATPEASGSIDTATVETVQTGTDTVAQPEDNFDNVAFGFGDVMLMGAGGLILGLSDILPGVFLTILLGALGGVLYLALIFIRTRTLDTMVAMPYGPYIALAVWILYLSNLVSPTVIPA